jgi:hypothetical protein
LNPLEQTTPSTCFSSKNNKLTAHDKKSSDILLITYGYSSGKGTSTQWYSVGHSRAFGVNPDKYYRIYCAAGYNRYSVHLLATQKAKVKNRKLLCFYLL